MRLAHAAAVVLAAVIVVVLPAPPLRAEGVDDEIKAVQELEKAGKDDECVAKMAPLAAGRDKKAFAALSALTVSKSDKVACGAIRTLTTVWHDPEYFRWLLGRVEDKGLADRAKGRPEVYKCVLECVRAYPPEKVKAALKQLGGAVERYTATEPEYADRAIRAYGAVPDRFTVEQLLLWLDQTTTGNGPVVKGAGKEAKDSATKTLLETLALLTGQTFPDVSAWRKWWAENGKSFKFPTPPEPSADGSPAETKPAAPTEDPSGLSEFKDAAFGWSVKKPEGDDWKFFRPDWAGARASLYFGTEANSTARAYFVVHDPAKGDPKDLKSFGDWATNGVLKDEFPDGPFKPAETTTKTIGGVEWTVVSARGLAGGAKSNWGSIEHRLYATKLDALLLYVDAYIRLSADAEEKETFWTFVESVALPAKK
jgi:hypothetical protein